MRSRNVLLAAIAAVLLAGCGSSGENEGGAASDLLDPSRIAALLSPEAKAAVESYKKDVSGRIAAYKAQYGRLPQSLIEIPQAAAVRETAVNLVTDGLAEQVPFASRETLKKAATAFVATAERQILDRTKAQDAPNQ
jgi:hypothetical protein